MLLKLVLWLSKVKTQFSYDFLRMLEKDLIHLCVSSLISLSKEPLFSRSSIFFC